VARGGAPPVATIPTATAPAAVGAATPATGVGVTVNATGGVDVTAVSDDGQQQSVSLGPGESISFMAADHLTVSTSDGGAVTIVVNGRDLGVPGVPGRPWSRTFAASGSQVSASP